MKNSQKNLINPGRNRKPEYFYNNRETPGQTVYIDKSY